MVNKIQKGSMWEYWFNTGTHIILFRAKTGQGNSKLGNSLLRPITVVQRTFSHRQLVENNLYLDSENCGQCPMSKENGQGGCYTHYGNIYFSIKKDLEYLNKQGIEGISYDFTPILEFYKNFGKFVFTRFGDYGEPSHIPMVLLNNLPLNKVNFTGYTHNHNKPKYFKYFTVSCDTKEQYEKYTGLGYHCAIVALDIPTGAIKCPALDKITTCSKCTLCNNFKVSKNIVFLPHGSGKKKVSNRILEKIN